jgi:hypothetical protein
VSKIKIVSRKTEHNMRILSSLPRPTVANLLPLSILAFVIATLAFQPWNAVFDQSRQHQDARPVPVMIGDLRQMQELPDVVVLPGIVEKISRGKDRDVVVITLADPDHKKIKCLIHVPAADAAPGIGETQWFSATPVLIDGKVQLVAGRWLRGNKTAGLKTEKNTIVATR